MSDEALTDDECKALRERVRREYAECGGAWFEDALIRAGYKAGAEAMSETCAKDAERLRSALVMLHQAYSNRHSPQHRASCLMEAQSAIDAARGKP